MHWLSSTLITVLAINLVITIILIFNMIQKYRSTRIRAVLVLFTFFIFDFLRAVIEIIFLLDNTKDLYQIYLDVSQPFPILFSLSGIFAAGVYLFFVDYYDSEQLPQSHIVVFVAILSAFTTFSIVKLYNISVGNQFDGPSIGPTPISFDFLPPIMITYLLVIAYPILYRLIKKSEYKKKTQALQGLMVSMAFMFIIPSIFVTLGNFYHVSVYDTVILATLIPRISIIIGNIILLFTYGRTSPAYLHSQRLEKLLAITRAGTPIYSLDFIEEPTQRDDVLISGSLTALSGLLAESINVTDLESIEFKEKDVLISHRQSIGFFLITDRPSIFVRNALEAAAVILLTQLNVPKESDAGNMTHMVLDKKIDSQMRLVFGIE